MSKEGTFKIVICGGRHFNDYEYLKTSCREIIAQLNTDKPVEIVSGHCMGCDLLGEKFGNAGAMRWSFPLNGKNTAKVRG